MDHAISRKCCDVHIEGIGRRGAHLKLGRMGHEKESYTTSGTASKAAPKLTNTAQAQTQNQSIAKVT